MSDDGDGEGEGLSMESSSHDELRISTFEVGEAEFAVISMPLADIDALDQLTNAEREVAQLALDGKSNVEIAEARGVSERTVANQLAAVYRKLDVNSRAELAAWIIDHRD